MLSIEDYEDLTYNEFTDCYIYEKYSTCKFCGVSMKYSFSINNRQMNTINFNLLYQHLKSKCDITNCEPCKQKIERRDKILKIKNRIWT